MKRDLSVNPLVSWESSAFLRDHPLPISRLSCPSAFIKGVLLVPLDLGCDTQNKGSGSVWTHKCALPQEGPVRLCSASPSHDQSPHGSCPRSPPCIHCIPTHSFIEDPRIVPSTGMRFRSAFHPARSNGLHHHAFQAPSPASPHVNGCIRWYLRYRPSRW